MRKKIVAGNWKMNLLYAEAMALADAIAESTMADQKTHVLLAPPFIYLHEIVLHLQHHSVVAVAGQNCSEKKSGSVTGEISAAMLASIGVDYVIIGHSERRSFFREENMLLAEKVKSVLENSLLPVYCCGETLEQRDSGKHFETVKLQLETGMFHLPNNQLQGCVIAYEPVWAIGTGVHASPGQAQEMHEYIRGLIRNRYGDQIGDETSLLYGGSVTPGNAIELFSCQDVDGGLVGGASLKAKDFINIIESMEKLIG